LYDRVSKWKSFTRVESLEGTAAKLIMAFFNRLERYHGILFVSHVFGLMAASKFGLSEEELLDMISCQDNVLASSSAETNSITLAHSPED